jgi:hypothetical protein
MSSTSLALLVYGCAVVLGRITLARVPDRLPPLLLGSAALAMIVAGLVVMAVSPTPVALIGGVLCLALGVTFSTLAFSPRSWPLQPLLSGAQRPVPPAHFSTSVSVSVRSCSDSSLGAAASRWRWGWPRASPGWARSGPWACISAARCRPQARSGALTQSEISERLSPYFCISQRVQLGLNDRFPFDCLRRVPAATVRRLRARDSAYGLGARCGNVFLGGRSVSRRSPSCWPPPDASQDSCAPASVGT